IILLIFFLFCYFFTIKLISKTDQQNKLICSVLPIIFFNFYLGIGHTTIVNGEKIGVGVNVITISLIVLVIFMVNGNSLKLDYGIVFFLSMFFVLILDLLYRAVDLPSYYSILFTYITLFTLYLIFKSTQNLKIGKFLYLFNFISIFN
ncbi:hypothetical protein CHH56_19015, partial [Terribacillus saccharophilus]